MKVKIMIDDKRFDEKPSGKEIGGIQNRIVATENELNDLAVELSNGCTFKPALLNGTKSTDWIQQQVFALDFDDNCRIESELEYAKSIGMIPSFIYTSFRHTEKNHKFRMVFVTDKVITDIETRNKLQTTLIKTFTNSDDVTYDATRMFFGGKGKQPNYTNYDARINAEDIISRFYKDEYSIPIKKDKVCKTRDSKDKNIIYDTSYRINIEAIKSLNVDVLKGLIDTQLKGDSNRRRLYSSLSLSLSSNNIEMDTEKGLYNYINNIDLTIFTGIEEGQMINCILPEHEDNTPSAHIYTTDDGTQIYKCFGCDRAFTIIGLVERLARCKRSEAIEFIKSVYNIKLVQSEWVKQQKQLMIDSANYLDTEEFIIQFPELSKLIRTRKVHIQKILIHFTQYVSDNLKADGEPLFFGSYSTLMKVCGIRGNMNTLSQSLILFNLLNMLTKVETEKIPEKELKKAKSIAAKYGHKKLTNFYQFTEYGVNSLYDSEDIAKTLKKNSFSLKGLSREYILRTFGKELADKVFPQHKYENSLGTSERSDNATMRLAIKAVEFIRQCC